MVTAQRLTIRLIIPALAMWALRTGSGRAQDPAQEMLADAFYDHLDEAEGTLDRLLDWRHVLVSGTATDRQPPTTPSNTLIAVDRRDITEVVRLVSVAATLIPQPAAGSGAARGHLRAHAAKATEISRELNDASAPAGRNLWGRRDWWRHPRRPHRAGAARYRARRDGARSTSAVDR